MTVTATATSPAPPEQLPHCGCGCRQRLTTDSAGRYLDGHRKGLTQFRQRRDTLDAPLTSKCMWCDVIFTGTAEDVIREHAEHRDTCTAKPEQTGPTRQEKLAQMKRAKRSGQDAAAVRETSTYKRIAALRAQAIAAPRIAEILTAEGYGDWTAKAIWAYASKHAMPAVAKKPPAPATRTQAAERPAVPGRKFATADERRDALAELVRDALAVGLNARRTAERLNAAQILTKKGNLWRPATTHALMLRVKQEQHEQKAAA